MNIYVAQKIYLNLLDLHSCTSITLVHKNSENILGLLLTSIAMLQKIIMLKTHSKPKMCVPGTGVPIK